MFKEKSVIVAVSTKTIFLYFICVICFSCNLHSDNLQCYVPDNLTKLSEGEIIERAIKLIYKSPNVIFKNCKGSFINDIERDLLDSNELTYDQYIDDKGIVVECVIREKNGHDELIDIVISESFGYESPYPHINVDCNNLKELLNEIYLSDQGKRMPEYKDAKINDAVDDEANIINILQQCGYPNEKEVGEKGMLAIFYVIQHAHTDVMASVYPTLLKYSETGQFKLKWLAMLQDRMLLRSEKKQLYGTQSTKDISTQKYVLSPVENPQKLNERRRSMGLEPLEDFE